MADVVAKATEPALAAIKLAWWRERLEELDEGNVPAEPRLRAAARELLSRGIGGSELAEIEQGWAALLQPKVELEIALSRGATLFALGARLIDADPPDILPVAGGLYAAGNLSRYGLLPSPVNVSLPPIPPAFRRLTMLAALAKRDLHRREPEATPGRAFALLRHRLTGRIS